LQRLQLGPPVPQGRGLFHPGQLGLDEVRAEVHPLLDVEYVLVVLDFEVALLVEGDLVDGHEHEVVGDLVLHLLLLCAGADLVDEDVCSIPVLVDPEPAEVEFPEDVDGPEDGMQVLDGNLVEVPLRVEGTAQDLLGEVPVPVLVLLV